MASTLRQVTGPVGAAAVVASLVLTVGASGAGGPAGSVQARWVIRDLGTLGKKGEEGEAVAINERGQVIGNRYVEVPVSSTKTARVGTAFLWVNGRMRDLGTLAGLQRLWPPRKGSGAIGINDRGQIVGVSDTRSGAQHAFLWKNGRMTDLGALGAGRYSSPVGINERGEVAGYSEAKSSWNHAFLWRAGRLIDLGTLGGARSEARAINDEGQIVGWSDRSCTFDGPTLQSCSVRPFVWQKGKMIDLGTLGGHDEGGHTGAVAINDGEQIVGYSLTTQDAVHAVLWRGGKMTDINPRPRTGESRALALNRRGEIVGLKGRRLDAGDYHAVLWRNGQATDLGTLIAKKIDATNSSVAVDINDRGYVVGASSSTVGQDSTREHAFVWRAGVMTDLGTLPGGTESWAVDINENNQIVGYSTTKSGNEHAVLWTLKPG